MVEGLGFVGCLLVSYSRRMSRRIRLRTERRAPSCFNCASLQGHCSVKVSNSSSGSIDKPIVSLNRFNTLSKLNRRETRWIRAKMISHAALGSNHLREHSQNQPPWTKEARVKLVMVVSTHYLQLHTALLRTSVQYWYSLQILWFFAFRPFSEQ